MPFAKARLVDQNNRSHEWSGYVLSNDRNQAKSEIYAQTNAKKVIISGITPDNNSDYRDSIKNHQKQENQRRSQREKELKNSSSVRTPNPVRYSSSNSSSVDLGTAGGAVVLIGGLYLFVTFMPWVLMGVLGSGGAWLTEKMTGQSLEEYTSRNDDKGHKRALAVILTSLILGGYGFVQGSHWQKEFNKDTDTQPKVEQVQPK